MKAGGGGGDRAGSYWKLPGQLTAGVLEQVLTWEFARVVDGIRSSSPVRAGGPWRTRASGDGRRVASWCALVHQREQCHCSVNACMPMALARGR